MARLPKVEPVGFAAPGGTEDSPFALPVARNLGPKPGESLFASPPSVAEPKLPDAKPKEPSPPEPEEPPQEEAQPKKEAAIKEPAKKELPKKEPPKPAPVEPVSVEPDEEAADEDEEADPSTALFLPSSTKEIVVDQSAKRAKHEALEEAEPEVEPVVAQASSPDAQKPEATAASKPPAGRQTAVYLAALAGAILGLFSIGAIYMMLGSDTHGAARPTGSSPFGKRSSGDSTMVPVLDDPAPAPKDLPQANRHLVSPVIGSPDDEPLPTSIPAPPQSKPVEPPMPGAIVSAPAQPAPAPAATPTPAPPVVVAPPKEAPDRPAAKFVQTAQPKRAAKPKRPAPVAAPKKVLGPQWVFEGVVYDLITTRGVYGVRLVFLDAEDNEVTTVEAGEGGQYRVSMDAGPATGYTLRIVHDDYSGKHIDELDSTSSVRKADLEQRKFLMQAGVRSLPWIGVVGKPVRRDMALVPNVPAE
jgi:hypothetical protein